MIATYQPEAQILHVPPHECSLVRTKNFTCLAFRDEAGRWHDAYHPEDPPLKVIAFENLLGPCG